MKQIRNLYVLHTRARRAPDAQAARLSAVRFEVLFVSRNRHRRRHCLGTRHYPINTQTLMHVAF